MSRIGACASVAACVALIVGSCCLPVHAEEGDEQLPPPPVRRRPVDRKAGPIRQIQGDEGDREPAAEAPEGKAAPAKRLPRGDMQTLRLAPITEEMLETLTAWEQKSANIATLSGGIYRITYDSVFMTEKRASGAFYYKAPDRGAFKIDSVKVQAGGKIRRNAQGAPFVQKPDQAEHWICTGAELFKIDHDQKTHEMIVIPPENRGQAIMDTPLPFLLGMKAEQARRRYNMKLLPNPNGSDLRIKVEPRLQKDAANYSQAEVLLDSQTYLPKAVKLIDPAGTKETVLIFSNLQQNKPLGFLQKDPTDPKPYIAGTKRVQLRDRPENAQGGPKQPGETGDPRFRR